MQAPSTSTADKCGHIYRNLSWALCQTQGGPGPAQLGLPCILLLLYCAQICHCTYPRHERLPARQ